MCLTNAAKRNEWQWNAEMAKKTKPWTSKGRRGNRNTERVKIRYAARYHEIAGLPQTPSEANLNLHVPERG